LRTSARCSKMLKDKKYIFTTVNSGHTVFQGKRKLLKNPECKGIPNKVKILRANSVFRSKRKLLKNLNGKKYVQRSGKFHGKLCFSGQGEKISIQLIQSVKAFIIKFLVWENTTRKEVHPLELTSKVTTEFAYNGTSRGLYKERYCKIEVMSEWKCM